MAILDTDPTNGWIREACRTATDSNDIYSLGVGDFPADFSLARVYDVPAGDYKIAIPSYHTRNLLTFKQAGAGNINGVDGELFGKAALRWSASFTGPAGISTTNPVSINRNSDWTRSFWLKLTVNEGMFYISGDGRCELQISDTTISLVTNQTNTVPRSTVPNNTWVYFRIVRIGATVRVYINGVANSTLVNTYATPTTDTFSPYITLNAPGSNPAISVFLRDFVLSNVARDGAVVPAGLIGFKP